MKPIALLAILMTTAAMARPAHPPPAPILTTPGGFIALSVADLGASEAWYRDKLGLTVAQRPPKQGPASVVILEGGGLVVELIQYDGSAPRARPDPLLTHGFFKAGFLIEDFDRAVQALRAAQVEIAVGPFPAREGQRANLILRDNAGNLIQLLGK